LILSNSFCDEEDHISAVCLASVEPHDKGQRHSKGKLMISYKEIRKEEVNERWVEMLQLNQNAKLKGLP
jgi:hypothetical protein